MRIIAPVMVERNEEGHGDGALLWQTFFSGEAVPAPRDDLTLLLGWVPVLEPFIEGAFSELEIVDPNFPPAGVVTLAVLDAHGEPVDTWALPQGVRQSASVAVVAGDVGAWWASDGERFILFTASAGRTLSTSKQQLWQFELGQDEGLVLREVEVPNSQPSADNPQWVWASIQSR